MRFLAPGIVHIHFMPNGRSSAPTIMLDPRATYPATGKVRAPADSLATERATVRWNKSLGQLQIDDAGQHPLLQIDVAAFAQGRLQLHHEAHDALYGIGSYNASEDAAAGMLRSGSQTARAGKQGHAGAPFVWSTAGYGVLLDSAGASYDLDGAMLTVNAVSRKDMDVYILLGTPVQLFGALATISGHAPLFPKWAMGFTNSQWGIEQNELLHIIDTYRAKHIPLDNFTLDFDWKAWGEDNYGEFRWNTDKFPDGPSGKLKAELDQRGVHLSGIMKPRIHLATVQGRYATAHDLWVPGIPASDDYFSHQSVRDLDFDKPAARAWFFNNTLKQSFTTGIVGWWNDEADNTGDDSQFLNMQRALYDGQRAFSDLRVWSINRNFWLGAQRYAYGLWSGDIDTGFASMADQRARMLSAINVGAMQWGMDGGGFRGGTPTPENYARWVQFGAFTPIFRVHGDFGQKRQPWRYGAVAEQAASAAIRLRYTLIPYIYSYARYYHSSGIGLVRPLLFAWPHDPNLRNDTDAWLFGDYLLVAPVVAQGQTRKDIYLPAGRWINWFSGESWQGGQTIRHAVDSKHWSDIPLFIREGAIIPTQPVMDYIGQRPLTELTVEVFPATTRTHFDYYDDDGTTWAYESGVYFLQTLNVQQAGSYVDFTLDKAEGSFKPALRYYLVKIHGRVASAVTADNQPLPAADSGDALRQTDGEGWASGQDRYGAVTWVKIAASTARSIRLQQRAAPTVKTEP